MSERVFKTYQSFGSEEEVEAFTMILDGGEVEHLVEPIPQQADSVFGGGGQPQPKFRIKVPADEFGRVEELLEARAREVIDSVPDDHYLNEFTDEELIDVLRKPDEWSKQDILMSVILLKKHGTDITQEQIDQYREERIVELDNPVKGRAGMLILGLIFSLTGGVIGLLIGWYHWRTSKTAIAGDKVPMFDEKTRSYGKSIFWIGIISMIGWIAFMASLA